MIGLAVELAVVLVGHDAAGVVGLQAGVVDLVVLDHVARAGRPQGNRPARGIVDEVVGHDVVATRPVITTPPTCL